MDFALAHGLNPVLETDYGNPLYKGGGGRDLAAGFPHGEEGLAAWDRWVDAVFTHASGKKVSRPGFWDGGRTFRVRFAPTKPGHWSWSTTCRGDAALDGKTGGREVRAPDAHANR